MRRLLTIFKVVFMPIIRIRTAFQAIQSHIFRVKAAFFIFLVSLIALIIFLLGSAVSRFFGYEVAAPLFIGAVVLFLAGFIGGAVFLVLLGRKTVRKGVEIKKLLGANLDRDRDPDSNE
ncbi:MAG: hypothetical protein LBP51_01720 [Deferribacteraceae bacterium]|jgi:hypothetical protein|nr:hypothetical protein [Deferribacteraceae bacterium]